MKPSSVRAYVEIKPGMAGGPARPQSADWPRLAEAPGSPRLDLALREASGAPAGPTAESHLAYGAGATPSPCRTASSSRPTCQVRVRVRARARVRVRVRERVRARVHHVEVLVGDRPCAVRIEPIEQGLQVDARRVEADRG